MRSCRFLSLLIVLAAAAVIGAAKDYCFLTKAAGPVGANPPKNLRDVLRELGQKAFFDATKFQLVSVDNNAIENRGTAAQVCNSNQQWIFYAPEFIDQIRAKGGNDWPRYFVLAHEVAHHQHNDPNNHSENMETLADQAAAAWLIELHANAKDLAGAIKAFVTNEAAEPNYPSRCDRVKAVIEAYELKAQFAKLPRYRYENCDAVKVEEVKPSLLWSSLVPGPQLAQPGNCPHPTPEKTVYDTDAESIWAYFAIDGTQAGHTGSVRWITPSNTVYASASFNTLDGVSCYRYYINVRNEASSRTPGLWKLTLSYDGQEIGTRTFNIRAATPPLPPGLYVARLGGIPAKAFINKPDIMSLRIAEISEDIPSSYDRDVSGMCAVSKLAVGDRLTWSNIGVCELMK